MTAPACACRTANSTCRSSSTTSCSTRTARRCSTCSTWTASWATASSPTASSSLTSNVKKCRYRFRLYAPGPSRWWEWSLWDGTNFLPFWQICTDGNLLPNAVQVTSVRIAVAERVDIIVDFSKINGVAPLLRQPGGAGQRPWPDRQDPHPRHAGPADQPDRWRRCRDDSVDPSIGRGPAAGGHEAARSAGHGLRRSERQGGQGKAPHLAVRARQRRLDGERQVLRREHRRCGDPDGLGRGLDHPEPRRLLASPGAHPLRRASDADPQRRTGEAEHAAQRRDRLLRVAT